MIWTVDEVLNIVPSILWTLLGGAVAIYLLYKLFGGGFEKSEERLEKRARKDEARVLADEKVGTMRRGAVRESLAGAEAGFRDVSSSMKPLVAEIDAFQKDKTPVHSAEVKVLLVQHKKRVDELLENMMLVVDTLKTDLKVEKTVLSDVRDEVKLDRREIKKLNQHFGKVSDARLQANIKARVSSFLSLLGVNEALLKVVPNLVAIEEGHISSVEKLFRSVKDKHSNVSKCKDIVALRRYFVEFEALLVIVEKQYVPQTEVVVRRIERDSAAVIAAVQKKGPLFDKIEVLQDEFNLLVAEKQAAEKEKKVQEQAAEKEALAAAK